MMLLVVAIGAVLGIVASSLLDLILLWLDRSPALLSVTHRGER